MREVKMNNGNTLRVRDNLYRDYLRHEEQRESVSAARHRENLEAQIRGAAMIALVALLFSVAALARGC